MNGVDLSAASGGTIQMEANQLIICTQDTLGGNPRYTWAPVDSKLERMAMSSVLSIKAMTLKSSLTVLLVVTFLSKTTSSMTLQNTDLCQSRWH